MLLWCPLETPPSSHAFSKGRWESHPQQDASCSTALDLPGGSGGKESTSNAGELGSIPGLGRSSGEGNGNPTQYSCLKNSKDRGAWRTTVHEVAKTCERLSDQQFRLVSDKHSKLVTSRHCWITLNSISTAL